MTGRNTYNGEYIIVDGVLFFRNNEQDICFLPEDLLDYDISEHYTIDKKGKKKLKKLKKIAKKVKL